MSERVKQVGLAPGARGTSPPQRPGFRADIQGLRAIAVSMVVLFHVWPNRLPGGYVGVDVFFVISGFLITSHLLASPPGKPADLASFWSRRIRRLLPASLLVLAVTLVATRLVAPATQWAGTAKEIIASGLYVQNWALAHSSVDYLAEGSSPSPVQHFWSLSVEEQYYLLWPLLIMGVFWLARRHRRSGRNLARPFIGLVVLVSLAYSIWATATEPASAYFVTPTRMWELAIGGLVAAVVPATRARESSAWPPVIAWAGIAAVVATGFLYSGGTPFPSYTALLPVVGCAVVIAVNTTHSLSPTRLLRARPIQRLGDISYSVYLWHWPLVALVPYVSGGRLGRLDRVTILVATVILAELSKRLVEDRYRRPGPRARRSTSFRFAAAGMATVAFLGSVQLAEVTHRTSQAKQELAAASSGGDPCFGAAALAKGPKVCPVDNDSSMVPEPALAKLDRSQAALDKCWALEPYTDRKTCTYGSGPTKVALVGNSHADHWLPALKVLADRNHWTITTYIVSVCNATDARLVFDTPQKGENCRAWGRWMLDEMKAKKYDLVVTSERQSTAVQGHRFRASATAAEAGYRSFLKKWLSAGTKILVLRDPTYPKQVVGLVPECVAEHPDHRQACSGTPKEWWVGDPLFDAAKQLHQPGLFTADLRRYFCTENRCRSVNGGVLTYYDGSHMSATYSRTLAPYLAGPVRRALESKESAG